MMRWILKISKNPIGIIIVKRAKNVHNFFKVDGNGEGDKMPRKVQVAQLINIKI
jgi:hypothetical protein